MFYPEEFIEKCKEVYPEWERLHQKLESGDEFVGRYLAESCSNALSLETILAASSLEELQVKARVEQEKDNLFNEWQVIYDEQHERGSSLVDRISMAREQRETFVKPTNGHSKDLGIQ